MLQQGQIKTIVGTLVNYYNTIGPHSLGYFIKNVQEEDPPLEFFKTPSQFISEREVFPTNTPFVRIIQ